MALRAPAAYRMPLSVLSILWCICSIQPHVQTGQNGFERDEIEGALVRSPTTWSMIDLSCGIRGNAKQLLQLSAPATEPGSSVAESLRHWSTTRDLF
jgi:hypothetical protein